MQLIDTHAHPHMEGYELADTYSDRAREAGVEQVVCVGTDAADSKRAIAFAKAHDYRASVGLHPHEASVFRTDFPELRQLLPDETVVAIGECGFDYHYENSRSQDQAEALHAQINLAKQHRLPLIFHIREAFEDFFEVFDAHQNVTGVVHSFTADPATMRACVARGLYVGLNGIVTFAKDTQLKQSVAELPLENIVLETDTPFLTPHPYRGKINNSAHVRTVAEFLSSVRSESLDEIARVTTQNARDLFDL